MSLQSREARVFTTLLVSMTVCALLMLALGKNPPSAGAFCLNSYWRLEAVEDVIRSRASQHAGRWDAIEVYYSGSKGGNIEQLASLRGLASVEELNCHFVIYNGLGGADGRIQSTERWQRQWSAVPQSTWKGSEKTIRICVISTGKIDPPTDYQIKRVEELVEQLRGKFDIARESVRYPDDW
ncbi:MAG TPA: N-acetylmuramoyl-L-alanine amidase [Sedimentisphaerales bacterium]|nr:N-acetylmuramoyl-L-alanine amidase [Sedimentisphaerales bacterium]